MILQAKYFIFELFIFEFWIRGIRTVLMQIIAQCPRCGNISLLDADAADRRIKCTKCHRLFKVPKLEEVPKAVKIIRQAKTTIYVDQNGKTYA
jgi:ribosomal protein S27AE